MFNGPEKAYLLSEKGDKINCLFNPSELTISKSNSWNAGQIKGRNAPELRFQGGQSATLSLSLTFDTTHEGTDVTIHTTKLLNLMKADLKLPGADAQRNSARPPWVQFHWGKLSSFKAIVERLQVKFTYFASDGSPLRAELYTRLTLVHVEESVHLPDFFALHFEDTHFELFDDDRFRLGTRVEIAFRAEDDPVVVTYGEITAISVEPGASGRHELVLTGLDLTHRLARGPRSRTFARMTDAAIASRIAGEYGLDSDVDSTDESHEYVLQAGETDYAFLRRIATRIGYDFWISEKTFHFKKKPKGRTQPQSLRWGENLRLFKVRFASAEHCDEVTVKAWDPIDKRVVTGRASDGDLGTDAPAGEEMAAATRRAFGRVTRRAGQFPAASQAEADALARSLLLRASGGEVVLRGEADGNPWLGAGADVKLERVGRRLAGKYRVTSVEHVYGADRPYVTKFVCGGKESADLADLLGPSSGQGDRRGWGSLVVGVVTNNDDPDRLGRVKVRYPTLSEDDERTWARVAAPGGGPQRGIQWLPEVDDEVLVGFELDDKTRPIVLGGMWSRHDKPPQPDAVKSGQSTARVLASRKNHRLVLTDDPTSAIDLNLGDAKCAIHLEKSESKLTGETKLVISAEQIEIKAGQKLVVEAPQIEVTAKSALKLTGKPIQLN